MSTVQDQIGTVSRLLGLQERDGQQARLLVASQSYDTDIADVWDAITSPERIPRWFLPVSGDLRLGGRYQLEGNAGGTILECDAPRQLGITWEYGGDTSWVEVRLASDAAERTTLELRHSAIVDDDKWGEFGPGAVGIGWDMALLGLSQHLSGNVSVRPEDAMSWMGSAEGKAFMTASGELWRDADIAAGTDKVVATAAADRCIAAYTAAPAEEHPAQKP